MRVTVLGKYGPYAKTGGATSSYLLTSDESTIAFEFGAGALSRLTSVTPIEKLDAVILSHFHFDHCSDLGTLGYALLRLYSSGRVSSPLKVYCPKDDSHLSKAIKAMSGFECVEVGDGDEIKIKDLTFKFFAVNHPVPCLGFRVSDGRRTFAYGGDSNVCANLDEIIRGADLALLDGGFKFADWNDKKPHLSVKHCSQLAEKHGVRTIITHINPEYSEGDLIAEIADGGGDCSLARENESYTV